MGANKPEIGATLHRTQNAIPELSFTLTFTPTWLRCLLLQSQVPTMYPIDQATYNKVNAYHIEFRTGALTSLRIPKIVDYYSDVEPEMVLKCIRVGNACDWNSYEVACGYYERHKDAFGF